MIQKTGSNRLALALVLLPITLLLIGLLTGTVAWFFLKMPAAAYDPLTLPGFFWYYRHDPVVTEALWRGAVIGVLDHDDPCGLGRTRVRTADIAGQGKRGRRRSGP